MEDDAREFAAHYRSNTSQKLLNAAFNPNVYECAFVIEMYTNSVLLQIESNQRDRLDDP
jgi:hypothetical protein